MSATISFGDYAFDSAGTPQWGRRVEYEYDKESDSLPRVARTTFTVKQTFEGQSFADNQAAIHLLDVELRKLEGLLLIKDENGTELFRGTVKVKSHDLPLSWRQYIAEVTISFETTDIVEVTDSGATFTPTGGSPIDLPNLQTWKQTTETERFNDERADRRQTKLSITASGFVAADKTLALALRRAALQQILAEMRACHSKDGQLVYGGESIPVRVDRLDGDIGDGSERLDWTLTCFYMIRPAGNNYAEADYTFSTRDDFNDGKRTISVRGNVRAANETVGKAKAEEIRQQYATGNRTSGHTEISDARLDGADGETWVDLTFDFEFSEPVPDVYNYELTVSTRDDVKSNDRVISYSGKVTAGSADDAIAQARGLGDGKYPIMLSSDLTVSYKKSASEEEKFVEVNFSYEYQAKSDWKYAELTREITTDTFGDAREVISGFAEALTETEAKDFAAQFKLSGRLLRDQRESFGKRAGQSSTASSATTQITRFDFTYTYYLTPASVSASYGREERTDFDSSETTITISGVARGPSETACRSFIDGLMPGTSGLRESTRSVSFEKQQGVNVSGSAGAGTQMVSVNFSDRYVTTATAAGPDIVEAQFSKKTVYSVNKAVITPIPFGIPFVQANVGWTPGLVTVSGSITARTEASAREWGRGKRSLLGTGGYEDQPEEDVTYNYVPHDPSTIKDYRFDFTYSARFAYLPFS